MRYRELIEKTISLMSPGPDGQRYVITKNPTKSQYLTLTSSDDCDMKGLIDDRDLYIWPSFHAHHHEIAQALGVCGIRIFVQHHGILANPEYFDLIRSNSQIRYLFGPKGPNLGTE